MITSWSFFNVLILVGSFQGAVTGLLLFLSPKRNTNRLLLAFILLIFVLLSFKILLHTMQLRQISFLHYFPLGIDLAIQPLIYLYVRSLTEPAFRFSKKLLYHLLLPGLFMLHAIIVYASLIGVQDPISKDIIAEAWHFNLVKRIEDYLVIFSSFLYWYLSYRQLSRYRQWLFENISASNYPEYIWLRNIVILTIILFSILAFNLVLDVAFAFEKLYFLHWEIFYVYMAGLIYFLGFKGYNMQAPSYLILATPVNDSEFAQSQDFIKNRQKVHEKNNLVLTNNFLQAEVEKAMEVDKLYLNPELNLAHLAKHLKSNPSLLSVTINTHYGKNFRNLINAYRVEDVKQKLMDPSLSHLSILGIALEAGFNSEASFYRIFKQHTKLSPTEYLSKTGRSA